MKSTRVLIRAKGRGLCIERGLYDCLQKELFADVTLHCDGGKIRANKGVLAAASPVLCHLLKDWPLTDDPCVIMAGYTLDEVQGLIRYIYTGQLSAPRIQGSSWEKIIGDFKVGSPIEHDDDLASIHELTDYGDASPVYEPEANGICHLQHPQHHPNQHPQQQTFHSSPVKSPAKGVGPKIVAVTSPRPLIVQVQSLTQPPMNQGLDSTNDVNDIPNEMTVEEGNGEPSPEVAVPSVVGRRKLGRGGKVLKRLQRRQLEEPRTLTVAPVSVATLKKLAPKRAKPSSKFARKKYVCPHCNRRFLTRGNIKNHLRIHSRDKPFQCSICQDLFSYQGVYQRHLLKHRDNNEIGDNEVAPMIADSIRLADEIGVLNKTAIHLENDEEEQEPKQDPEKEEAISAENDVTADVEEEENADLMEDEEAKIALKLKSKAKLAGSSKTNVCSDEKVDSDPSFDDGEGGDVSVNEAEVAEFEDVKGKTNRKRDSANPKASKEKVAARGKKKKEPKARKANYHYQVIECDFCPMRYHKWSAFYIHRCTHTGETPVIPCSVCEMEFPNIKALKEHKVMEHRESIFPCDGCDRTFLSKSALLLHQPIHSNDFNYQCRSCPEKMRTFRERYVHERTHSTTEEPQTPHECSHCQKQFNTLVNLRYHLKVCGKETDA
ncbi:zinc finger protein 62 homolog [Daphnia pulex]|uniref:zinc finger protein 62 homolog n=1 Tax=Daphnia pulex TaxID=6669 RepID=UPI001EDE1202|nr:zinc finger protein 62 homolog [Daphnia pulex]XP_046461485.1 zinc finger protein 62 homolog [Daphnia pulex]XP_046461486.1 zinc finger protein 62 homolog [Daphnia pulex]